MRTPFQLCHPQIESQHMALQITTPEKRPWKRHPQYRTTSFQHVIASKNNNIFLNQLTVNTTISFLPRWGAKYEVWSKRKKEINKHILHGWLRLGFGVTVGVGANATSETLHNLTPRLIRSLTISTSPYDAEFSENIKFLNKRNEHNVYTDIQDFHNIRMFTISHI